MSKRRIAITGAGGFIGRHLVSRLARQPVSIAAGYRNTSPQTLPLNVDRVQLSGERPDWSFLLRGADTVIHLGGLAAAPAKDAERALRAANVDATYDLVDAARQTGCRRIIFMSSIRAIAGSSAEAVLSDETTPRPADAYGRSKRDAEAVVAAFAGSDRLAISLRPPLVIGPDARGNWERLMRLAAGPTRLPVGGEKRSYLPVDSLCRVIEHIALGDWPEDHSGAYCVADPDALPLGEVIALLRAGMGVPQRSFPLPASLARIARRVPIAGRVADSLFGRLEIDPSRLMSRFEIPALPALREAIRACGAEFAAKAGRG